MQGEQCVASPHALLREDLTSLTGQLLRDTFFRGKAEWPIMGRWRQRISSITRPRLIGSGRPSGSRISVSA